MLTARRTDKRIVSALGKRMTTENPGKGIAASGKETVGAESSGRIFGTRGRIAATAHSKRTEKSRNQAHRHHRRASRPIFHERHLLFLNKKRIREPSDRPADCFQTILFGGPGHTEMIGVPGSRKSPVQPDRFPQKTFNPISSGSQANSTLRN